MKKSSSDIQTTYTFPGVGIALCGYEKPLYKKYEPIYRPFFEEGSELVHSDLSSLLFAGPEDCFDELTLQIFIYCFSAGTFDLLSQNKLYPDVCAGYSFGIYAALFSAGALSFSNGLKIVRKAFAIVDETAKNNTIQMSAVVGLSLVDIREILTGEKLNTAYRINSNNEFCHVLCGDAEEMTMFEKKALEAEALNVVTLDVKHPYHHPHFCQKASAALRTFLDTIEWQPPRCPVISTIDQKPLSQIEELQQYTAGQIAEPINWHKTIASLYSNDFTQFIECGPGLSLTQNARFIPGQVQWINTKNMERRLGI